jgi:hypothetical protein
MRALRYGLVAHGFDIVTIRPDDERAVVVGVVMGPEARGPVVFAPSGKRCLVERIDLAAIAM